MRTAALDICFKCHQPITMGSSRASKRSANGTAQPYHLGFNQPYCSRVGCPTDESILDNLREAMEEGFTPEFCRTHYTQHQNK
jgi:hypothetical protein